VDKEAEKYIFLRVPAHIYKYCLYLQVVHKGCNFSRRFRALRKKKLSCFCVDLWKRGVGKEGNLRARNISQRK
jgi:hypothetical protein